jgi:hypothetical protein
MRNIARMRIYIVVKELNRDEIFGSFTLRLTLELYNRHPVNPLISRVME